MSGGKVETFEAGTSTPKVTFTTEDESTANANPVILDAAGRADIWLASGAYKFVLKDANDVIIKTVDNITGGAGNVFGSSVVDVSANTNIVLSSENNVINCTATLTISLLDVATAGEGFLFSVKNSSSGLVTVDPDAAELIDGAATKTIQAGGSFIIVCTGTAWLTICENFGDFIKDDAGKILVSSNDTTAGDLETKLLVGAGLALSTQNDGANETRTIDTDINSLSDTVITAADELIFGDVSDSNNRKKDTVQGILDLTTSVVTDQLIKAWVAFDGSAGSVSVLDSFNVTSVTENATGEYIITWDTDFANVNYCPTLGARDSTGAASNITMTVGVNGGTGSDKLVGSLRCTGLSGTTQTAVDQGYVMAIGDQ